MSEEISKGTALIIIREQLEANESWLYQLQAAISTAYSLEYRNKLEEQLNNTLMNWVELSLLRIQVELRHV